MTYEKQIVSLKEQLSSSAPSDDATKLRKEFDKEVGQLQGELEKVHKENRQLREAIESYRREKGVSEERTMTKRDIPPDLKSSLAADTLRAENEQLKEKVIQYLTLTKLNDGHIVYQHKKFSASVSSSVCRLL